jgi:hypothetical protein
MTQQADPVSKYVREHVSIRSPKNQVALFPSTAGRFTQAFSLLPEETLDLFLSGRRFLQVEILPDPGLPLGMKTQTRGSGSARRYTIIVYHEHFTWPKDLFIGAFLRELGHVVAERPPEDEWPADRGARARFKERIENLADAMVWRWGLRHYSMRQLYATYPSHRVEQIVAAIEKIVAEEEGKYGAEPH